MGTRYAQKRDVYDFGLPRGTVGIPPRHVSSATAATDLLELEDHGFETDDVVQFRAKDGGALPAPLAAGTNYYVIATSDATFQVASSQGGSAVDLTEDGSEFVVTAPLPFDRVLEFCSRYVDPFIPAHAAFPEDAVPLVVTGIVATFAAQVLQRISGVTSVSVTDAATTARLDMQTWAKGVPLKDPVVTTHTNKAVSSLSTTADDPRGWGSGDCIR